MIDLWSLTAAAIWNSSWLLLLRAAAHGDRGQDQERDPLGRFALFRARPHHAGAVGPANADGQEDGGADQAAFPRSPSDAAPRPGGGRADRGADTADGRARAQPALAIAEQGSTILLVEHNLDSALAITRRLYVIGHGRIVLAGTPAAVRREVWARTGRGARRPGPCPGPAKGQSSVGTLIVWSTRDPTSQTWPTHSAPAFVLQSEA